MVAVFACRRCFRTSWAVLVLMVACVMGCGNATPTLVPARGKVVNMKPALAGATVQFASGSQPPAIAQGRIGADGTFTLQSTLKDQKVNGVPAGRYQVVINPGREAVTLAQPVTIEAGQEEILLELPK